MADLPPRSDPRVFNFARDRDLVESSPAARIPRPAVEQARDRVLTEDELRVLWNEFQALDATMAAFYKLRSVTDQRGGVATMHQESRGPTLPECVTRSCTNYLGVAEDIVWQVVTVDLPKLVAVLGLVASSEES